MRKITIIILLLCFSFLCLLGFRIWRYAASAPRVVKAYYPKMNLLLIGEEKPNQAVSYTCLAGLSASWAGPLGSSPLVRDLALVFDGIAYPVHTLTSGTLGSLGFTMRVTSANSYYMNLKGWPKNGLFRFRNGYLAEFSFVGSPPKATSLVFSYRGAPEQKLPLSQAQMEAIFGKPDRITRMIALPD